MLDEFLKKMAAGAAKIILLFGLIGLGIVFMPEELIVGLGRQADNIQAGVKSEVDKRSPALVANFYRRAKEMEGEISKAWQAAKEKVDTGLASQIKTEINSRVDSLFGKK